MSVQVWCQTDLGLKRQNNEDSFLLDPDLGLYIVADGMGGHSGGEVASQMAVQAIRDVVFESYEKDSGIRPQQLLAKAYSIASHKIYDKSLFTGDLKGMGTTLVVALIRDQKIFIANVGDSRAYLLRQQGMWQVTEDHSLVNEQIKAGVLKEENEKKYLQKNIITRSVGFEKNAVCDIIERPLTYGDHYIICTDGLSGMVTDQEIFNIASESEPDKVTSLLIEQAKANGGLDNVTVMYVDVIETKE